MHTSLFVISDLHLGGAPSSKEQRGFQICPPETQRLLAAFVDRLSSPSEDRDVRLVIAGDVVDFLAEEPFEAFTSDPAVACKKLEEIARHTQPVWCALAAFVERGGALTLLLGNHDIELSLPAPRQWLLEKLGPGRVEFLFDNQAFAFGRVLIEHGNRFDAWNAVPHDALRRVRSQLSRRLPVNPQFPVLPGSRLVVDVMNGLKKTYPFIDLLKPEDACALPIVAALGAGSVRDVWRFFRSFRQQRQVDYDEEHEPLDPELIADPDDADAAMFRLAENIAAGGDAESISSATDLLRGLGGVIAEQVRNARRAALLAAFRGVLARPQRATFEVDAEIADYLTPARRAAAVGFDVIVYGHTHLAKRVALAPHGAVYLNSGTWADLMRLPDAVTSAPRADASAALEEFVDDLAESRLERWRRSVPTYARIDLDGERVVASGIHFGDDDRPVTTEALLARLAGGSGHG